MILKSLITSVPSFEFALLVLSIGAGIFGSILGLGGGIIIVPVLTLLFGINIRYAIGASIVSVIATSSGAAVAYLRDRITNIRLAILLEVATTVGAVGGAALSTQMPKRSLFLVFAVILLVSAWMMMLRRRHDHLDLPDSRRGLSGALRLNSSYPDHFLKRDVPYFVRRVPLGFILMLGAGGISGLLGIGSGALKVPAMDVAMNLPIKVSSATSNFMIGVTAAASAGAYFMRGDIIPFLAAPVALGVLLGSWMGSRIMLRLHSGRIRVLFVGILLLVAIQMGLRAFGIQVRLG